MVTEIKKKIKEPVRVTVDRAIGITFGIMGLCFFSEKEIIPLAISSLIFAFILIPENKLMRFFKLSELIKWIISCGLIVLGIILSAILSK